MKKSLFLLIALILIAGCGNNTEVSYEVSNNETDSEDVQEEELPRVEEILSEEEIEEMPIEEPVEEEVIENVTEEVIEVDEAIPELYKKCRYSAIAYGGCYWLNKEKASFELTIGSGAPGTLSGLWFRIHGVNETRYIKKTDSLLKGTARSYILIYADLVKELGYVSKFEVLPIEEVDGREVACENQRASFVPVNNCRLPAEYNNVG
ncbi:hypothetical protein ACFLZ7_00530 [Nanoarchaeota archaeon]